MHGAAGDEAGAAPGVVGAAGLVALVRGEGAVEVAGAEHHHLVPHADGLHAVRKGADGAGEVVHQVVVALILRGGVRDLRDVRVPAADLHKEDLPLVGEHAAAGDHAGDDFELVAEFRLGKATGEPVGPMLVERGIRRGGLRERVADEAFGVARALRDADVGLVKEAFVRGGEDLLQSAQAPACGVVLIIRAAERIAAGEAADAVERVVFVRWRGAAEVVRIKRGVAQRGAVGRGGRAAGEAGQGAHRTAAVHEVRLLGEADLKAVRTCDADADAEVAAVHAGDDFRDAAAPALGERLVRQGRLPLHLLVGVREELRRLRGGRQRVEVRTRDVLRADERADIGYEGEVLAVEEAFERIRAGMEREFVLRVVAAAGGIKNAAAGAAVQRRDARGDLRGVVVRGAVEVAVVGGGRVVELRVRDADDSARAVVVRACRGGGAGGHEHVVGIAAAIQEDAHERLVVVASALSRRRADELHLRDRVHHGGEPERRAAGLEQKVAAVGLAAVFGLFEEDVHGEESRVGCLKAWMDGLRSM